MKSLRGTFQSMHVRNFRLFFTGQLISQGGTWMQTIALNWLVLQLSHNNGFLVGLAIALQFLPTLLFGVWGGAIADRFDKRKVLLCTQVAMAAVAVVLTVLDVTGVVQLWMLYVLVFTYGLALAVDNPTRQSFVSELVPPADLPNAIGLSSAIFQLARVLGPALAGVLILAGGTAICFGLNAVSFVFVILALLMMRPEELHRSKPLGREKGQLTRRPPLHLADGRAPLDPAADAGGRHLRHQLAGRAAAAGQDHVRLRARGLQLDVDRHGRGCDVRRTVRGQPLRHPRPRCSSSRGWRSAWRICVASLAPSLALFIALLVIVGAGQIAFLSIDQLVAAAPVRPDDARPRHGRLHDHPARARRPSAAR